MGSAGEDFGSSRTAPSFEGAIAYDGSIPHQLVTQLYRNGIIEAVNGITLTNPPPYDDIFPASRLVALLGDVVPKYLRILQELQIAGPLVIAVSLLGIRQSKLAISQFSSSQPIERDSLLFPEVWIESSEDLTADTLRPAFELLWNAYGLQRPHDPIR